MGCIGSFEPRKGQKYLLDAAKMLVDDGRIPNIHLLMVGEGRDKEMLQARPALPRSWDTFQGPSQTRMRQCSW